MKTKSLGKFRGFWFLPAFVYFAVIAVASSSAAAEISAMVVAVTHFGNPGRDLHNVTVDDVLSARRQAEIQDVTAALTRFKPTKVLVEWPNEAADHDYKAYCDGSLSPSRNEVVQLGFRLAHELGLPAVRGVDVSGDFPYKAVELFAKQHNQEFVLRAINLETQRGVDQISALLRNRPIRDVLRFLNRPSSIAAQQQSYRRLLSVGAGSEQPGADLLTAWYGRNFRISANIVQSVEPGDRVIIFYGAGHAFLLRQLVSEMPGWTLVEPNSYL